MTYMYVCKTYKLLGFLNIYMCMWNMETTKFSYNFHHFFM